MARGRQMGRLKLIPPDAETRRAFLYDWDAKMLRARISGFPTLDAQTIFGNRNALEVEIGPGTGEYLSGLAAASPSTNFLGIEASRRAVYHAVHLANRLHLENIRFIRADVKLLHPLIAPQIWSKVYLHFPDPVHKRKDEKRRIFDPGFLDLIAKALQPGGEISIVSDKSDFFFEMLELAEGDSRFAKAHPDRYLEGFEPQVKSRFQRAWENRGVVPLHFVLRKRAA